MSTHTTHYPLDPDAIKANVYATTHGRTLVSVSFDVGLEVVCVSNTIDRMHPQVFARRLRELADEIDRKCGAVRDDLPVYGDPESLVGKFAVEVGAAMSSAQERAAEILHKNMVWGSRMQAAALAAANLLVDDDTARLVERGRQAEEADAHVDELLASVTDEDREQLRADIQRQARHLALGRAVEAMRRINSGNRDYGDGWNQCLDAIYREAGVSTPPETQDQPLSAPLPVVGNPSDGPVVPREPSEGDRKTVLHRSTDEPI